MTQSLYRPDVSGLRSCAMIWLPTCFRGIHLKDLSDGTFDSVPTIVLMPHARFCFRWILWKDSRENSCASSASRLGPHQEDPDAGLENIQGVPFDAAYGVQADIEADSDGFEQHHVQPATVV